MAKKPTDIFLQFAAWTLTWPAVSTTLVEEPKNTGLSVRGGLMWLVHLVELLGAFSSGATNVTIRAALSIIKGATIMPRPADKGYVAGFSSLSRFTTSGMYEQPLPAVLSYLPPVPIAAPNLSGYIVSDTDVPGLDAKELFMRIGYTTEPLDAKGYAEIAETWAQV